MLRITASESAARAKSYFGDGLSRDEYLSEGQEVIGNWGGKLAARLGLSGTVEKDAFDKLVDNINPLTGANLTPRTREDRTPGYDFTFSICKSASILSLSDPQVIEAFRASVAETMRDVEAEMKCRVRKDSQDFNRTTSSMLWGDFLHRTARPTKDAAPDPHVHMHVYCLNVTYDEVEGIFKAGQFRDLKRDAPYWQAAADARFALRMKALGYEIQRMAKGGHEVAGFDPATLKKFSLRTQEIDELARQRNIISADEKAMLGAVTRQAKAKDLTWAELQQDWLGRLSDRERKQLDAIVRGEANVTGNDVSVERAFDYAIAHSFERQSTISEKRLLAEALKRGIGSVSVEDALREARRPGNGLITREIQDQRITSTLAILKEEQAMLAWARDGRGTCRPLAPGRDVEDQALSDEQRAACLHLWQSTDSVLLVRGAAGVGKTRLMKEAVAGIEAGGTNVFCYAPSADASRGTLRGEGFSQADTLATLLTDTRVQAQVKGGVIWIDEAGQVGRDMGRVFQIAQEQGARVLLSGDVRQHGPVARTDSLRLLEDYSGLKTAQVVSIRRQTGRYRDAVKALSRGEAEKGFEILDSLGFISELGDDRHRRMAADYVQAIQGAKPGKALAEAICIAPTHSEGAKITAEIRQHLKAAKRLGKDERTLTRLEKLALTTAERGDALSYRPSDVIQLVQNIRGFHRGERLAITGRDDQGLVLAKRANGETIHLPLGHADRFQVFKTSELAVAPGETIRITNNGFTAPGLFGKKHRLDNGSVHTVKKLLPDGTLKLTNGWIIPKDFAHLDHGYCQTSFSAQSRTTKRVFIAQGAESLPATDLRQFYVSVSRGKVAARVYCTSKAELFERIHRADDRLSAVELVAGGPQTAARPDRVRDLAALNARLKAHDDARAARLPEKPQAPRLPTRDAVKHNELQGAGHER